MLNELGLKYGTDKSTLNHCYLDNYERYFESWRHKEFIMWEIGVAEKRSINMWREYFPKALIYGLDINPECTGERIFIGSQSDIDFLDSVLEETGIPSIIIDDGSHKGHDIKKTFRHLFPIMKKGFYVIEDTHCFYDDYYASDSNVYSYLTDKARDVDVNGRGMTGNTEIAVKWHDNTRPLPEFSKQLSAIHIHPSVWFFEHK